MMRWFGIVLVCLAGSQLVFSQSDPLADFGPGASSSAEPSRPQYMERPGGTGEPTAAPAVRHIQAVASTGLAETAAPPQEYPQSRRSSLSDALARAGQVGRRMVRGRTPEPALDLGRTPFR